MSHIQVRLDFWRRTATRIHVRFYTPHRKTTNSNDNQVCRTFYRPQRERILFVCYKGNGVHLAPIITQSSDDHHRDTLSVDHRWERHGSLHTPHGYLLLFTFPPSLFRCSRLPGFFQDLVPNVEVCPIQTKTGFQLFSGLTFRIFEKIQ
jgi:hypothetical protein